MAEENTNKENVEETLEEKLAKLTADYGKLKKAFDKTASEAADFKKRYNATLSEKELAEQEQANAQKELQAKYDSLLRENSLTTYERNYIELGYSAEQAKQAAVAQADGDMDSLFKIQKTAQDAMIKAKQAEWLKGRPQPNSGGNDAPMKQEDFDKLSLAEKTKLFRTNKDEYNRLCGRK